MHRWFRNSGWRTVIATVAMLAGLSLIAQAGPQSPNVVLFLIDDLGWADLGVTGSTYYETPRVDALAEEGAFFSDAYAASPVCSPTRASILTGKYPSRIKMSYLASSRGPQGPTHKLIPPHVVDNMPLEDTTLAEALQAAGYTTAHIGKWHLQSHHKDDDAHRPEKNGFDVNIAGHRAGQPGSFFFPYKSERHAWSNVPDMEDGKEGDYLTDALTDKAIHFIEANQDQPFYLNMWYHTVHTPIQGRKDKVEKYRKKAVEMGLDKTTGEAVPDHQSFSHAHQDNASYAAMVESMDENIGRILDALKRLDLEEDTIVIFFSDNGGLSTGSGPKMPTSNLPLRAGKAWLYEGGIREPLIVKLPGRVKAGLTIDEPVTSTDLYPTILELAGLPLRPEQHVDGMSLKPLLVGEKESLDREAIYFHLPHYHHINTMGPSGAVRMGDYKLVEVFETGKLELYNLREDIGEQNDLSASKPELAARMKQMMQDWRTESGSLMTTQNPDYDPDNDWRKPKSPDAAKAAAMPNNVKKPRAAKGPDVENKPINISCAAIPGESPDGVLVAQGGEVYGYAVYVQGGKPCFSVRNKQALTTIRSSGPAPKGPYKIEASLAAGGGMVLRVDGEEVASGNAGSLISTQPGVGFSVGQDMRAPVGPYELPFAYAGKVSEVVVNGEALAVPVQGSKTFFTPKQDLDGLKANTDVKAGLPNVLIIGDSISIGYTESTIALLKDVANVQRVSANCGDTNRGLKSLKRWLGDTRWDVIHFNWGLHDLCYRHPDSKHQGRRDKVNGTQAVPPAQYEKNLETLVQQLKETGATLIWASTTVVPEGEAGRVVGDDVRYNEVAAAVMRKHGIAINDLHALSARFAGQYSQPGNVHYSKEGSAKLAEQVAAQIRSAISK